jgi:uncharacterized repeat protein (TIGR03803 family)
MTTGRANAQSYSVTHAFAGGSDGENPFGGLLEDSAGNFYGTTTSGGGAGCGGSGCGTVFRIASDGPESILYAFRGGTDGAAPWSSLVEDANGNLYGTTTSGGQTRPCKHDKQSGGCGTVFKLAPDGTETVLYAFTGGSDGGAPAFGSLLLDESGNLYGTTQSGGTAKCGAPKSGCGVVFELKPDGSEFVLHAFKGGKDGYSPEGSVITDGAGNLYGTTALGGTVKNACNDGCGTVYEIAAGGKFVVLHRFVGSDGANPEAGLIMDTAGNLFGTTNSGGPNAGACGIPQGCGTVFRITPNGEETTVYAFQGGNDGIGPAGVLVQDSAGNLYGTTVDGGGQEACNGYGCGTIFEISAGNTETVLEVFPAGAGGQTPRGGVTLDASGNLFGTTSLGGDAGCNIQGCGIVFELSNGDAQRRAR